MVLELNKEKTYVGTAASGFEFMGFYFQGTVDENGLGSSIKIRSTKEYMDKVVEIIKKTRCAEKDEPKNENGTSPL